MRDKFLIYAIGISVALHFAAVGVVGRASALKLNAGKAAAPVQNLVKVDFVDNPDKALEKPKPAPVENPKPVKSNTQPEIISQPNTHNSFAPKSASNWVKPPKATTSSSRPANSGRVPGNPGGKLNVGSMSSNGDLGGNWSGGKTPVGYVPGSESGKGQGSGSGPGVGHKDPDEHASDGPGLHPAPASPPPPPPPSPKMVSVRVCNESGMIPGEYCKHTHKESFIDGKEPSRTCTHCKAPEPVHNSRLADRAKPKLIRNWNVSIPSSVADGSYTVVVGYTVTEDGNVTGVKVVKSSGNRAVDRAVISAASDMKYQPAVQDGVARSVNMTREWTCR